MQSILKPFIIALIALGCFAANLSFSSTPVHAAPITSKVYIPFAQAPGSASNTPGAGTAAKVPASPEEQAVLDLVNKFRAENGCNVPLRFSSQLIEAARGYSRDLATMTDDQIETLAPAHRGTDGSTFSQRIRNTGYTFSSAGENIAYGYPSAESVVTGWIDSAAHRANMLNCNYTEIGIGYISAPESAYGHFWTQDFASPR